MSRSKPDFTMFPELEKYAESLKGDDPTIVLMRHMAEALAEYGVNKHKAATKAALNIKRSKGQRTGQIPFGSRLSADGIHLEDDPDEQKALALIHALRADGMSLRSIARELEKRSVQPRGSRWHTNTVSRIVKGSAISKEDGDDR